MNNQSGIEYTALFLNTTKVIRETIIYYFYSMGDEGIQFFHLFLFHFSPCIGVMSVWGDGFSSCSIFIFCNICISPCSSYLCSSGLHPITTIITTTIFFLTPFPLPLLLQIVSLWFQGRDSLPPNFPLSFFYQAVLSLSLSLSI